jgi:hypothetical protein
MDSHPQETSLAVREASSLSKLLSLSDHIFECGTKGERGETRRRETK